MPRSSPTEGWFWRLESTNLGFGKEDNHGGLVSEELKQTELRGPKVLEVWPGKLFFFF